MSFRRIAVIMAGGSGERFWPLSRKNHPKQMLKLADPDKSLIAQSADYVRMLVDEQDVFIATVPHLVEPLSQAVPGMPLSNVFAEPYKRNTAGCLVWVAANLMARFPDDYSNLSMAVVTADHRVSPGEGFAKTMDAALTVAEQTGGLSTIGIRPDRPETGYGYIEIGDGPGHEHRGVAVRPVGTFREKPDASTAQSYVESGKFLWNSGTFYWTLSGFLKEMEMAAPDLHEAILNIFEHLRRGDTAAANATFEGLRNISIDYALMEQAKQVFVAEAAFDWDDVGSWDSLERSLPADAAGNVTQGETVIEEASGNIVVNDVPGMVVTALGVDDLVVVVTKDAVLVLPKSRSQEVKKIVERLKNGDDARL